MAALPHLFGSGEVPAAMPELVGPRVDELNAAATDLALLENSQQRAAELALRTIEPKLDI